MRLNWRITERNGRDYALVMLTLGAGLRVSELTQVKLADFYKDDTDGWWVRVVPGQGAQGPAGASLQRRNGGGAVLGESE